MIIKEYRIVMPLAVEEYQIAQLWSVAESSRRETGGGDGVEVLENESFENEPLVGTEFGDGQFTKKRYYLQSKMNGFIRKLLPNSAMVLEESAWNSYPYCRTHITNEYMRNDFQLTIETMHMDGRATQPNVHRLNEEDLAKREIVMIDIAGELLEPSDYCLEEDPTRFTSRTTSIGPLRPGWMNRANPVMTCYKLVKCNFEWFGLQTRVERFIQRMQQRIFTKFHRQVYCWVDQWNGLTMEQVRDFEISTAADLERQRAETELRGNRVE